MSKRISGLLKFVVFLGIGVFFIYWFLLKLSADQKQAVWQSFLSADYFWVAVAMLCSLLSHFVRALRWRLLYKPLGLNPSIMGTFGSVVVAYMANMAFPRLGEVMRCSTMRTSDNIPIDKSLGTVVTERLIDVVMFGIVVLLGLLFMYADIKDWLYDGLIQKVDSLPSMSVVAVVVLTLIVLAFLFYKYCWHRLLHIPLFKKIDDLVRGCVSGVISIFHLGTKSSILFIVYSAIIYLLYIVCGLIVMQAFSTTVSLGFKAAFAIYLFGSVGMIFSQGGLGVYPVLVQMALALYLVPMEVGTAAGWLLWGSQQVVVIVFGMCFLIYFSLKKKKSKSRG
ncbi:MAG: flippase-like domain-containing protein [Bacteroidales bacterium]|nr:flippase-like domain-containing protein [Candidatus Colimorpha onthohippi]